MIDPGAPVSAGGTGSALLVVGDWPRVEHITWSLRDNDTEFFTATISAMLEGPECADCLVIYHLELDDLGSGYSGPMSRVSGDKWTAEIRVQKKYVELWWPNGYGDQKLYDLRVVIEDNQLNEVDNKHHRKVGFRTIELVQEPLSKGLSFYFKVNGQAIFMKGSNWIPANVLGKYDEDYYLDLLFYHRGLRRLVAVAPALTGVSHAAGVLAEALLDRRQPSAEALLDQIAKQGAGQQEGQCGACGGGKRHQHRAEQRPHPCTY